MKLFALGVLLALISAAQSSRPGITTTSLGVGTVGQPYREVLRATGGTPPFQWSVSQGALPAGLTLDPSSGIISGTPTTAGSTTFQIQVTDSASQQSPAIGFTLAINPPVAIATTPPLFIGTVGQPYVQTFAASGGTNPYTWSALSAIPGGLKFDSATGVLQGTPQSAGSFSFTVQVVDATGGKASQAYTLTINSPSLTVTLAAVLASGTVGVPYNQKLSLVATGGTAPVTWSLVSGSVPGIVFEPSTLALSGVPTAAGTFTLTIQARDAAGLIAARTVNVVIAPASLAIATDRQLPGVLLNDSYSYALSAAGGAPPYTWSANGLPAGLSLDPASGTLSGTASAAGTFSAVITVRDTALAVAQDLFTITVSLPAPPTIVLSGLPPTVDPRQQIALEIAVGSAYVAPITGTALLTFVPETGLPDRTVVFASGSTSIKFTVPAGSTTPQFESPFMLQTGTVAGSLTVTLSLSAGSRDITPTPAPSLTAQIPRAAPVITDVQVTRSATGISITATGYSTTREITQAVFAFTAASGQTLQPSASSMTVDVGALFSNWFQNAATTQYGSQFAFTQPFTVDRDVNAVVPVSVTLKNRNGETTFQIQP
jgi:large repetitive protein